MALSAFTAAGIINAITAVVFIAVNTLVVWLTTYLFDYLINIEVRNLKKAFFLSLIGNVIVLLFVIFMHLIGRISIFLAKLLAIIDVIVIICLCVYLFYRYFYKGIYKRRFKSKKRQQRHEIMISIGATAVSLIAILLIGILLSILLKWLVIFIGIGPAVIF
ncbi:MAG: hypothetical protein KAT43_05715 [Nanoarchaeota archaeon]|nr:hypothetical protein [Nanoarchaeota archaeon]